MKYYCLLISILFFHSIFAQSKLPIIKANSKSVDINDDGYLHKNAWTLSPKSKPDVYTADRTRKTKWVTFYTDIDSFRAKVKPGSKYNFIILLNGKDSCFTQITSAIAPENKLSNNIDTHDTIPFTLTPFNAIHVKSVINDIDTLNLHFDLGSFDFRFTKDAILRKTKLLPNQQDALAGKAEPDYNHLNKVFKLQMGTATWNNPAVGATSFTAHDMDGRFGWNLFEGKIVQIDYDKSLLIIHSKLPESLKGYRKLKLEFIHSFVCIKGSFEIEDKKYTGNFLLDTGSDQAIILDSGWAAKQNFPSNLKLIKSSVLKDPRGVQYESKTVLAPVFKINNYPLKGIPTLVLGTRNPTGFEINYLGNDLLKRFNIILDFTNDYLYLEPNKLINLPYRGNS
jgi:hypothetical protein